MTAAAQPAAEPAPAAGTAAIVECPYCDNPLLVLLADSSVVCMPCGGRRLAVKWSVNGGGG